MKTEELDIHNYVHNRLKLQASELKVCEYTLTAEAVNYNKTNSCNLWFGKIVLMSISWYQKDESLRNWEQKSPQRNFFDKNDSDYFTLIIVGCIFPVALFV